MTYAWVITFDLLNPATEGEFIGSGYYGDEVGTIGPGDISPELKKKIEALGKNPGHVVPDGFEKFKLFDDDDTLYYMGIITGDYDGFEPLDDFGMPNAGCTDIKYWDEKSRSYTSL